VGGMIKAARFLTSNKTGRMVYIIEVKKNTTEKQIADHLSEYLEWITDKTNLRDVFVISDKKYCPDSTPILLFGKTFYHKAYLVKNHLQ